LTYVIISLTLFCSERPFIRSFRKAHPCGSYEWEVVRVGADIGLKCQRRALLKRGVFKRRVKNVVVKSD
jgi:hypothetical protein